MSEYNKGFRLGFVVGCLIMFCAAMLALTASGCRLEPADTALRSKLEAASDRAAARADSMMAWNPARVDTVLIGPSYAAAKVAAVMADNGITLPQVAAYLQQYNWVAVPGPLPDVEWASGGPGPYPVTHHIVLLAVGVGGTSLPYYLPNAVGSRAAMVAAVDSHGNISRISLAGWSDDNPAAALPGMARFVAALNNRTIAEVEQ